MRMSSTYCWSMTKSRFRDVSEGFLSNVDPVVGFLPRRPRTAFSLRGLHTMRTN